MKLHPEKLKELQGLLTGDPAFLKILLVVGTE
jgi:hypothetical protein